MSDTDVTKMKVADLKRELKLRGLPTTGNKTELSDRLQAAIVDNDAVLDESALNADEMLEDEDVLNDDELDDETKSLLDSSHEDGVLDSINEDLQTPPNSIKSKSPDEPIADTTTHKKVILNRKINIPTLSNTNNKPTSVISQQQSSVDESNGSLEPKPKLLKTNDSTAIAPPPSTTTITPSDDGDDATQTANKTIKLSELSAKERLEMRAKKFGSVGGTAGASNTDQLKLSRAQRFGISDGGASNVEKVGVSVDVLKKRAERFGGSVSKVMNKIENTEKLKKRLERFKTETGSKGGEGGGAGDNVDYVEKARLRLEKFKQPIK